MADPHFDPLEILAILEEHEVCYVLIGGFAATIHGSPLRTDDADICPADDEENLERLTAALADLEARIATPDEPGGVDFPHDPEFLRRVATRNLVTRHGRFDISFEPSGTRGYDDLRRRAVRYEVGDGLVVTVAALVDVIRSKEAAGREKDRQMLPTLRRLLERADEDASRT
jgi:hypothetical protein